jgi:hypothetical protein
MAEIHVPVHLLLDSGIQRAFEDQRASVSAKSAPLELRAASPDPGSMHVMHHDVLKVQVVRA